MPLTVALEHAALFSQLTEERVTLSRRRGGASAVESVTQAFDHEVIGVANVGAKLGGRPGLADDRRKLS